jgi:hypothetical protein
MVARNRVSLPQLLTGDVPHTRFLQQRWVQDVLPLITSLTLHATIVVIGVLAFRMLRDAASHVPKYMDQPSIPQAVIMPTLPGGVENPGLNNDPTRPAAQDRYEDNTSPVGFTTETNEAAIADAATAKRTARRASSPSGPRVRSVTN